MTLQANGQHRFRAYDIQDLPPANFLLAALGSQSSHPMSRSQGEAVSSWTRMQEHSLYCSTSDLCNRTIPSQTTADILDCWRFCRRGIW